jgi:hypothetical protein
VNDELTEKVARAILEDEQKSAEASGCDILLFLHEGHRAAARAAIRIVVEECAKVADIQLVLPDNKQSAFYHMFIGANERALELAATIRSLAQEDDNA